MTRRQPRRVRLQFDALERRETPTAGMGGALAELAAGHPAVAHVRHHRLPVNGSGTAVLISAVPSGSGESVTGVIMNGTLNGKSMHGTMSANVTTTKRGLNITGTATFQSTDGILQISFTSTKTRKSFNATGGTGAFAGAKGRGQLSGSVNSTAHTLTFSFHGTLNVTA